jgi:transposase InsO family protein
MGLSFLGYDGEDYGGRLWGKQTSLNGVRWRRFSNGCPNRPAQLAGAGVELIHTPPYAPKANAICEGFIGSVRRECLDHILILSDKHIRHVIREY